MSALKSQRVWTAPSKKAMQCDGVPLDMTRPLQAQIHIRWYRRFCSNRPNREARRRREGWSRAAMCLAAKGTSESTGRG